MKLTIIFKDISADTPLNSIKVPKTVSEVAHDLKESAVQMAKKLDEKIGGKGRDEVIESDTKDEMLVKN